MRLSTRNGVGSGEVAPGLIILRVVPDKLPFEFKPPVRRSGVKARRRVSMRRRANRKPSVVAGARLEIAAPSTRRVSEPRPPSRVGESQAAVDAQAAAISGAVVDPDRMIRRAYSIASESRADE